MQTKFFLPESDDRVDPGYDFLNECYDGNRKKGIHHDVYAHELFGSMQCDGILLTRSNINQRRKEEILESGGIHSFLRLPKGVPVMSDCGAFQYKSQEVPPYDPKETVDLYEELGFDMGITLDHLILEFDPEYDSGSALLAKEPSNEMMRRYKLTLDNAKVMLNYQRANALEIQLLGAVQGWSPKSYANGAKELIDHGFSYIALGGLAKASDEQIKAVLSEVGPLAVRSNTKVHILGVARLSLMEIYQQSNVASCDSASAILQAFKSNKDNYHTAENKYTAVRIPPATGDLSPKVRKLLKEAEDEYGELGRKKLHKKLISLEQKALADLRAYARRHISLENAMNSIIEYEDEFKGEKKYYPLFEQTLRDRPWEKCDCAICKMIGVEVILLRGNNRNRRRGFHNTYVFFKQFKETQQRLQKSYG